MLLKYYPGSYFGYDREGAPVFIDPVGQIDFRGQLEYGMTCLKRLFSYYVCGSVVGLCDSKQM